ncbi:MAG: CRTAC1 family protein [Chloroflexi bacterium]|nr:CRTAC1 family protein [Chloroflexota bacterium]
MVGRTMPFILEAFPTFRGYAEATIDQIYGARLAGVGSYAAATLAHTVFTNDGAGRFTAAPLPIAAQATAAYGITTADLDNDGLDDLYLVGNFHGADHEIMAYSGGVSYWLKGQGDGTFTSVPTAQSGLFVPYEGRGLAVSDYDQDGWVDVAVGLNNHAPLLFHNGGVPGHNGLRIRLAGPVSNPTGVGARITVTLPDGANTSREIHAGNGYLSQDSATLVFGLGTHTQATVTVRWPDGHVTTHQGAAGQLLMAAP